MAQIEISGLNKSFGDFRVLTDIDLSIADQELVVLLGPSGCGKTTLLNIIAGLETETDGEIKIGGRVANALSPAARNLGFVFQSYALYPNKTVYENMAFALHFKNTDAPEFRDYLDGGVPPPKKDLIDRRVREIARTLQIEDLLGRLPRQLSGGERQRVAMGRALVRKPNAYLFDEPLSNLDAVLRVSVRQEIKDTHEELKATMVYVTHDQVEAMSLADRIVVMNHGEILQVGTPKEVYSYPATTFVARFIGNPPMNLSDANVVVATESVELQFAGGRLQFPRMIEEHYRSLHGRKVIFGIRPEHITLVDKFPLGRKLRARVIGTEYLGSGSLLHVEVGSQRLVISDAGPASNQRGDNINLFLDMTRLRLFDAESGKAIRVD